MATSGLLKLPPELIFDINNYLPPDATLSLKLTHPILNNTLPVLSQLKNRTLSNCARFAIERHCTSSNAHSSHIRCIVCKAKLPVEMFQSSSSPACITHPFGNDAAVLELPPYFCAWHVGRLVRDIQTDPGGRDEWVSSIKRMCMHSSCIQTWGDCTCSCDSCCFAEVRTYTRYRSNREKCSQYRFWRNMAEESADPQEKVQGRLYVRESSVGSGELLLPPTQVEIRVEVAHVVNHRLIRAGATRKSFIDLPVRYEGSTDSEPEASRSTYHVSDLRRIQLSKVGSFHFDKFSTAGQFFCTMPS